MGQRIWGELQDNRIGTAADRVGNAGHVAGNTDRKAVPDTDLQSHTGIERIVANTADTDYRPNSNIHHSPVRVHSG